MENKIFNNSSKLYPNVELDESIMMIIKGEKRFGNKVNAFNFLNEFCKKYEVSKIVNRKYLFVIFIENYELTKEEIIKGYTGNYAGFFTIFKDGMFICKIEKLSGSFNRPNSKKPLSKYPDSRESVLKEILNNEKGNDYIKFYSSKDAALNRIETLHLAYLQTSRWLKDKQSLTVGIYSANPNENKKVKNYVLKVKETDGKYYLIKELGLEEIIVLGTKIDEFYASTFLQY